MTSCKVSNRHLFQSNVNSAPFHNIALCVLEVIDDDVYFWVPAEERTYFAYCGNAMTSSRNFGAIFRRRRVEKIALLL